MRNRLLTTLGVLALLAACSSDHTSTTTSASTTPSVAPATTGPATTVPGTTVPGTTAGPSVPPTSDGCTVDGDLTTKESADPMLMSGMLGADIRTGRHDCYERVVVELLGGTNFPGWSIGYVNDPVSLGESGETVFIQGAATLRLRMGMWMQSMEGDGYQGEIQLFPTTVDHIVELRLVENWEGVSVWAIGLDQQYPFKVFVLHSPERLVIDVQTGG